jgi:thiamine pyrophosphokinase
MKVVVVASGELDVSDAAWLDDADLVIAADGGAASLDRLGRTPDVLVGDLDSIDPTLVARLAVAGTTVERHPVDKEASDTELAVELAIGAGARSVVVLGAMGGSRLDHELANLLLLADPALAGHDVRAVRGSTLVRAVHDGERLELNGSPGELVTLLPVGGDALGVTTEGLRWPLTRARLRMGRSRGLSNEVVASPTSVRITNGTLLVVEATPGGGIS